MNEYIEVEFRKPNGQRLRVKRQLNGGIEFEESDPIERTVGIQINGRGDATKERMKRIARVKGCDLGQFKLVPAVEDGNLANDDDKLFYAEGSPTAPIHQQLLDAIPADEKEGFKKLLSFRSEGRPSLQLVIAVPPVGSAHTYAEFDLDLANPLQDVLGFVFHVGELLDGKATNHLDLRKKLSEGKAGEFLYYTIA